MLIGSWSLLFVFYQACRFQRNNLSQGSDDRRNLSDKFRSGGRESIIIMVILQVSDPAFRLLFEKGMWQLGPGF